MVDKSALDVDVARRAFADELANIFPKSTEFVIRPGAVPEATAIHCAWWLAEKGPYSGDFSREITVQITSGAMNHFREAHPIERGAMLGRFMHIVHTRLLDGQYNEQDPSPPAFIISIDEHSLEP